MRTYSIFLLSLIIAIPPLSVSANESLEPSQSENLFVTLTAEDPEIQFMALVISMEAAREGANLRILLCGEAGDLALSGVDSPAIQPANISPADLLGRLLEHGAIIQVCAIYLPQRNLDRDALRGGITTATPPEIAQIWQNSDYRIITF